MSTQLLAAAARLSLAGCVPSFVCFVLTVLTFPYLRACLSAWLSACLHHLPATDSSENIGASSVLHNTLAIQNTVTDPTLSMPPYMQPDDVMLFSLGSQQAEGYANAGDPNTTMADTTSYTSLHSVSVRAKLQSLILPARL